MEAWIAHRVATSQAVCTGQPPPPPPPDDVIGHASSLFKHVHTGQQSLKGTEAEAIQLRKKLYAMDTRFGNHHVWFTITPDDLMDPIVAAYAGFVPKESTHGMSEADKAVLFLENKEQMAATIAANPVACAMGFRAQIDVLIAEVLGWDVATRSSNARVLSLVVSWSMQVCQRMHVIFSRL